MTYVTNDCEVFKIIGSKRRVNAQGVLKPLLSFSDA